MGPGPTVIPNVIPGESWECSLAGVSSLMPGDFPRSKKVGLQLGPLKEEKNANKGGEKMQEPNHLPTCGLEVTSPFENVCFSFRGAKNGQR